MRLLQGSLDAKQSLLSDVPGTGISLRYGTKLRQVYGHGGIDVALTFSSSDDPTINQLWVSGQAILDQVATKQDIVTDGCLQNSHVSGLQAQLDRVGGSVDTWGLPSAAATWM